MGVADVGRGPTCDLHSTGAEQADPEVSLQLGEVREDLGDVRREVRGQPAGARRLDRAPRGRVGRRVARVPELVAPPLDDLVGLELRDRAELVARAAPRVGSERSAEQRHGGEERRRDEREPGDRQDVWWPTRTAIQARPLLRTARARHCR